MSHPSQGRFVWMDLMTKDKDADLAFFGALVGWTHHDQDMGEMGSYTMLSAGETGVGGLMPMPAEETAPSHWIGYCIVDDVEASIAAATAAGARVLMPPSPVPDVGTISVIADPSGAVFAPMQAAADADMTPQTPSGPGCFVWWELVTDDVAAAQDFYAKVVGWGVHEIDMEGRPYWLWTRAADAMNPGGMLARPKGYAGPGFWLYYIWVEDVDAATARVDGLGGRVIAMPEDVPNQGRMSVIASPGGAQVALFTPSVRR
ncbi:MAG: VOC family protein [Chloroflexi bacterium]|nr:VOC family protein [Chloroflexota bacterium]